MAEVMELIKLSDLDIAELKRAILTAGEPFKVDYDGNFDALYLYFLPFEGSLAVYYPKDSDIALLYEMDSLKAVGLQIEAFQKSYVRKHPDILSTWNDRRQPKDFGDAIVYVQEQTTIISHKVAENARSRIYGIDTGRLVQA